jgi:hypothetical protein
MLALLLTAAALAPLEPASKAMTSLTLRADASSFICIGTVDRTASVPRPRGAADGDESRELPATLEFARIRVERVIKGDPKTEFAYHEAWPTWLCDTTRAAVGKRALFLLGPGSVAGMTETERGTIEHALGTPLVLRNVFSGDGVIPIEGSGEREFVRLYPCPAGTELEGEPYACRWKPVLGYVETLARFAPEKLALHAQRNDGTEGFDLRVLPDGRRRFARRAAGQVDSVVIDAFEAARWKELRMQLERIAGAEDAVVGESNLWAARTLRIRGERQHLELYVPFGYDARLFPEASRPALVRALEAWCVVRGALACDACADDREADRKLLEELKRAQ